MISKDNIRAARLFAFVALRLIINFGGERSTNHYQSLEVQGSQEV